MPDIVVVGGGIVGAATAYWLADEGHEVALLEAHAIAAMGSGWSLGGVRQSGRHPAEMPLAKAAVALWPSLAERLGRDVEYRQNGNLRLARTPDEVNVIRKLVEDQRAIGLDLTFLPDNGRVRDVAPVLSEHVLAASYCTTDGHANPALTTVAFADAAARLGATIREGVAVHRLVVERGHVSGVETSEGFVPAGVVVVAGGILAPDLLAPLGIDFPIAIRQTTVLQTEPIAQCLDQVFGVANADCAGRQEVDGRLRVSSGIGRWPGTAATWREADLTTSAAEQARIVDLVSRVVPVVRSARAHRFWIGLIDVTPDALPVIDQPSGIENLVVAAGFSGHGFGIGPATGQVVADLALQREPRLELGAFRLSRFAGRSDAHATLSLHG
ncbi:MAG TPA: FAD-binding oxidoreductase [Casimicrobiaceae bacterium]|nr:FAD-binding oxidoreductase [Casimicrobiaceae bacterium]